MHSPLQPINRREIVDRKLFYLVKHIFDTAKSDLTPL
jgi:hypothetical protein